MTGTLIVWEGIDGAGKTTQVNAVATLLAEYDPLVTREPTRGVWGLRTRDLSLTNLERKRASHNDRLEHANNVIRPALDAGRLVLCDRYALSMAAYQGKDGGDAQRLYRWQMEHHPAPHLTVYVNTPYEVCLNRVFRRPQSDDPGGVEMSRISARYAETLHLAVPVWHTSGDGDVWARAHEVADAIRMVHGRKRG